MRTRDNQNTSRTLKMLGVGKHAFLRSHLSAHVTEMQWCRLLSRCPGEVTVRKFVLIMLLTFLSHEHCWVLQWV